MARLPTVGGDSNGWGTVLNEFLGVAHNSDGTLKNLFTNVMDYGATGDGSTDDTAAIQAAMDASLNVFFPPPSARYKFTTLRYRAGHHLLGLGCEFTQLRQISGTAEPFLQPKVVTSAMDGLTVAGLHFAGFSNTSNTGGLYIERTLRAHVEKCKIDFFNNYGIKINGGTDPSTVGGEDMYPRIIDNYILNSRSSTTDVGIWLHSSTLSRPDGGKVAFNLIQVVGIGIKIDGIVTNLGTPADGIHVSFNDTIQVPTPLDIEAQDCFFFANRFEHTSSNLTIYNRPNSRRNFFGLNHQAANGVSGQTIYSDLAGDGPAAQLHNITHQALVRNNFTRGEIPRIQFSGWVADNVTSPYLGATPKYGRVVGIYLEVTEAFNGTTPTLSLGNGTRSSDGSGSASVATYWANAVDVSSTGIKTMTLNKTGYQLNAQGVIPVLTYGASAPTTGKAIVILEYERVPDEVA